MIRVAREYTDEVYPWGESLHTLRQRHDAEQSREAVDFLLPSTEQKD
jgi:hypothetical protein